MNDYYGLTVREFYHRHFGICQLVYVAASHCWIGLNESRHPITAVDRSGMPELERLQYARYIYPEWMTYLQILDPTFEEECPPDRSLKQRYKAVPRIH